MTVPQRPIGSQGLTASAQGFGAMGMSAFYTTGSTDEVEHMKVWCVSTANHTMSSQAIAAWQASVCTMSRM